MEFHAVNSKGDKSMARETVSVDTTAPVILLESPISGGTFSGDKLHVKGVAESDAKYTFKIDGTAVTPTGKIFKDGLMDCYLPLTGAGTKDSIVLTIKAVDEDGNATEKMMMLSNSELSKIKSVTLCAGGSPVTDAVVWASGNGIVKGYADGTFKPNDKITRQELAAMLYRYSQFKAYDVSKMNDLSAYTDENEIGSWAMDSLKWANAQGLVKGRTDTTIVPRGNATRAESAAMLMRFVENVANQTE